MKNIKSQHANNDIYNIAGDFNVINSPEVISILNLKRQEELTELHSLSYFDILSENIERKKILERQDIINEIEKKLIIKKQLILFGSPGIGKSTIVYQFAKSKSNIVYISVKDKSPLNIYTHLVNKIRLKTSNSILEFSTSEEALNILEVSLRDTSLTIMLDDCEQQTLLVEKIMSLEKFNNSFLYITRNKNLFLKSNISFLECKGFSNTEIKEFLSLYKEIPGYLELSKIQRISKGNPLYLFYLITFNFTTLPEDLISFQEAIWASLEDLQQEILIYISISQQNLNTIQLSSFLNSSPLTFSRIIDTLSELVNNVNSTLHIFHPTFKEFILEKFKHTEILEHYQIKLGDYFLEKNDIVQATYLLIDKAPQKVDKYLLNILPYFINSGELLFSKKILQRAISINTKNIETGYLYYHMSMINNLLGNQKEAREEIKIAKTHVEKTKNKELLAAILINIAADLVDQGQIKEATNIADNIFLNIQKNNKKLKGPLLVTLSKIYVDISEFDKAAIVSKEAFEIFQELENKEGIIKSLANLISSLAQNDDYLEDAEKYALKLLDLINTNDTPFSIEIILLNALTSIYRRKQEYDSAKKYCEKVISLCQKYNLKNRTILNLINYGNIFRDEGNMDLAISIYNEALENAIKYDLKKDQGRIYWILASIETDKHNFTQAIEYAERSFEACSCINFYYGMANSLYQKASALGFIKEYDKAAVSFEECAYYFKKIEQFKDNYQTYILKAINSYRLSKNHTKEKQLIDNLLNECFLENNFADIEKVIEYSTKEEVIIQNYMIFFQKYFGNNNNYNIVRQVISFLNFSKKQAHIDGKILFKEFINIILNSKFKARYSYSLLGLAIEQSGVLLTDRDINLLINDLSSILPLLSIRSLNDEFIILTSIKSKINLEIKGLESELISKKLALSLILLLHEEKLLIVSNKPIKTKKLEIIIIVYNSEEFKNFITKKEKKLFSNQIQSLHLENSPYMIIIGPEFEKKSNLFLNQENKGSFNFYFNSIIDINKHFYNIELKFGCTQRASILQKTGNLLGYTDVKKEEENKNNLFKIDFNHIKKIL